MLNSTILWFTIPLYLIFAGVKHVKKESWMNQIIYLFLYVNILNVISLTLFPIPFQKELIESMQNNNYIKHNFIPFKDTWSTLSNETASLKWKVYLLGGNLALLIPLGVLLPILKRNIQINQMVLYAFFTSLSIETTQLLISSILGFNYRSFSVDDLILNTLGGFLGYLIYRLAKKTLYRLNI